MPPSPAPHPKLPAAPSVEALLAVGTRDEDVVAVVPHTVLWRIHATTGGLRLFDRNDRN